MTEDLLHANLGIHPTTISESFQRAATKAVEILDEMSTPVNIANDDELLKLATTSLNSKVVSQHSWLLAPMAVNAIKKIIDIQTDENVNLKMIKLVKKLGDTVEESQLIEGALIEQKSMGHGGPTRIEKAKIGLIQFQLSPPKTNVNMLQTRTKALNENRVYRWKIKSSSQTTRKWIAHSRRSARIHSICASK